MFVSDHVVIKCSIDFLCPTVQQANISYQRYHRIDMDALRTYLQNTPSVNKPASSASELYKHYVHDLGNIRYTCFSYLKISYQGLNSGYMRLSD